MGDILIPREGGSGCDQAAQYSGSSQFAVLAFLWRRSEGGLITCLPHETKPSINDVCKFGGPLPKFDHII